ncbi:MAG: nicotinate phosphoribosyltransferase [Myxococcales bacterium]|nr:nicotinate phosphoribosyltransferase [Myxococcales bacterium]
MHALLTDRYQLTMLAAYARAGLAQRRAVFELFVRRLPASRRYLVACGIGRAVALLGDLRFEHADLAWLAEDRVLGPAFADPRVAEAFRALRFRGKVWAVREGRVCFPGEPLVRVEGTLVEAQLVETLLLSIVNHDTRVASKCARIVEAAAGRDCFEFGTRRTHEHAAVDAARAAYVAGFSGTSNEEAARRHGVPVTGTMAHAFVLAHAADAGEDGEEQAFADFARTFAGPSVCLVDTFETSRGVERAIAGAGPLLAGVRIDSGDLLAGARDARKKLDAAGLARARVVLSDDLDEYKIAALVADGAPVDTFGVGTMAVSTPDAPSLGAVYKLVAMEDAQGALVAVQKRAGGKGSSAGVKQVFRTTDPFADVVGRADEVLPGSPLLELVFDGERATIDPSAAAARARFLADRAQLGAALRSIAPRADGEGFPVTISPALAAIQETCTREGRVAL